MEGTLSTGLYGTHGCWMCWFLAACLILTQIRRLTMSRRVLFLAQQQNEWSRLSGLLTDAVLLNEFYDRERERVIKGIRNMCEISEFNINIQPLVYSQKIIKEINNIADKKDWTAYFRSCFAQNNKMRKIDFYTRLLNNADKVIQFSTPTAIAFADKIISWSDEGYLATAKHFIYCVNFHYIPKLKGIPIAETEHVPLIDWIRDLQVKISDFFRSGLPKRFRRVINEAVFVSKDIPDMFTVRKSLSEIKDLGLLVPKIV